MNAVLIVIFGCACATALPQNFEGRIIDGNNARRRQFPYMVSIQVDGKHRCGASIISQTWLVSAAHCFEESLKLVAVAGLLKQGENHRDIQTIPIEDIVIHPGYSSVYYPNDIALLSLQFPLTFNKAVQPVNLPQPDAEYAGEVVVSGWGHLSEHPIVDAYKLQYLTMNLITNNVYITAVSPPQKQEFEPTMTKPRHDTSLYLKQYRGRCACGDVALKSHPSHVVLVGERPKLTNLICNSSTECNQILATAPTLNTTYPLLVRNTKMCALPLEVGQSACHHDSGGPLVQDNTLVGIVHGGDCRSKLDILYPTIFTRVASYMDFIRQHAQNISEPIF